MNQVGVCTCFLLLIVCSVVIGQTATDLCHEKSNWGPWRCPGVEQECTSTKAYHYKCPEGDCTEHSQCTSLTGFTQTMDCNTALKQGFCQAAWAAWTSWSSCSATCGIAERTRYRACVGVWNAGNRAGSCADQSRAIEGVQKRDCPMRRLCPRITGGWGEWGQYSSCGATCGTGIRQRVRLCNRPSPQGGGITCQGIDSQQNKCSADVACAIDGNWCPWSGSVEQCSAACGDAGMGLRMRRCGCPIPSNGGQRCQEPPGAKETARLFLLQLQQSVADEESGKLEEMIDTGEEDTAIPSAAAISAIRDGSGRWDPCNRKYCPYSKWITDSEQDLIVEDLRNMRPEETWAWSGEIPARLHDPVGLHCPSRTRASRTKVFDKRYRFPRAKAFWTRSIGRSALEPHYFVGTPLVDNKRIQISGDRLVLRKLDRQDEGVYRFGYEYEPKKFSTICFFVVYLEKKISSVLHGKTYKLTCNAVGLWPIIQQSKNDSWSVSWNFRPDAVASSLGIQAYDGVWETTLAVPLTADEIKLLKKIKENEKISRKKTSAAPLIAMTVYDTEIRKLDSVSFEMSGQYLCVVKNQRVNMTQRNFVTNSIHLVVKSHPTLYEYLSLWMADNYWNIMILLCVTMLVTLLFMAQVTIRSRRVANLKSWQAEEERKKMAVNLIDTE